MRKIILNWFYYGVISIHKPEIWILHLSCDWGDTQEQCRMDPLEANIVLETTGWPNRDGDRWFYLASYKSNFWGCHVSNDSSFEAKALPADLGGCARQQWCMFRPGPTLAEKCELIELSSTLLWDIVKLHSWWDIIADRSTRTTTCLLRWSPFPYLLFNLNPFQTLI